jgi:hypothetical protein
VKYWEIIADNLSKAGWSWGCVNGQTSSLGPALERENAIRDILGKKEIFTDLAMIRSPRQVTSPWGKDQKEA